MAACACTALRNGLPMDEGPSAAVDARAGLPKRDGCACAAPAVDRGESASDALDDCRCRLGAPRPARAETSG